MERKLIYYFFVFTAGIILMSGCVGQTSPEGGETKAGGVDWKEIELTDVATGDKFKISDFKGRPVLLESFAVWCPTCGEQQRRVKEMTKRGEGEDIVHVSIDTDPNEDVAAVKRHIEDNGFDWYYAISPIELTNALKDEFGLGVINAPSVPMILICEDQTTRYLKSGLKTGEELLQEVEKGC